MNSESYHIIKDFDGLDTSYFQPREILLENSEQELVAACKKGERQAQKRVYNLFSGKMLNICRRYAKDDDHAQDLMHDGFIKVFMKIDSFQEKSSLQTWITRIMINNSISAIRKEVKKGIKVDVDDVHIPDENIREFELIEKKSITAQQVFEKLKEMPWGYRTVLSMYVLDGFTHAEIAKSLNISAGTSKSQLAKAKKLLAKMLKEAYL